MGKYRTNRGGRKWHRRLIGRGVKSLFGAIRSRFARKSGRRGRKSLIELGSRANPNKRTKYNRQRGRIRFGPAIKLSSDRGDDSFKTFRVGAKHKPPALDSAFAMKVDRAVNPPTVSISRDVFRVTNNECDDEKCGIWYYIPVFARTYIYRALQDCVASSTSVDGAALWDGMDFNLLSGHAEISILSSYNANTNYQYYELTPRADIPYTVIGGAGGGITLADLNTYLDGGWRAAAVTAVDGGSAVTDQDMGANIFMNERIKAWYSIKKIGSGLMRPGETDTIKLSHGPMAFNHIRDGNLGYVHNSRITKVIAMHFTPQYVIDATTKLTSVAPIYINGAYVQTCYIAKRVAPAFTHTVHSSIDDVGEHAQNFINDETDAVVSVAAN